VSTTYCANCRNPNAPPLIYRSWSRGPGEPMCNLPICARCIEASKRADRELRARYIASGAIVPLSSWPTLRLLPEDVKSIREALCGRAA
jgi:hypothetical protein